MHDTRTGHDTKYDHARQRPCVTQSHQIVAVSRLTSKARKKAAHRTASSAAAEWPNFSLVVAPDLGARADLTASRMAIGPEVTSQVCPILAASPRIAQAKRHQRVRSLPGEGTHSG